MEKLLKIVSWVEVVIGMLAIIASFSDEDFYAFVGGILFLGAGVIALNYIKEVQKK